MDIAVIGTGNIGGTLGRAFAASGHTVSFGSRDPSQDDVTGGSSATVTDIASALARAEVVVIAVPGPAVAGFVQEHAPALAGKLVIDCANIIRGHPTNSKDVIAAAAPDARYVRAFNTLGWENLRDPHFGGQTADMFFSAPMTDREMVETLIHDVGLRPVFLGEGAQDVVDMLLPVWFALATQRGSRHVAFRVLED